MCTCKIFCCVAYSVMGGHSCQHIYFELYIWCPTKEIADLALVTCWQSHTVCACVCVHSPQYCTDKYVFGYMCIYQGLFVLRSYFPLRMAHLHESHGMAQLRAQNEEVRLHCSLLLCNCLCEANVVMYNVRFM